jgi:uncharacterized protein (DUF58 family)
LPDTAGVYVSLQELIALRSGARAFSLLPRQPVHSLLSGRHASKMRGRGLNFEELRTYLPGDDIRTVDWKVTARTRTPHVRVFTEERDRPAMFVVDQRLSMFFGTRRNFKSVTAAELAAAAAWRVFSQGDRVGAVVFDDRSVEEIRPHRSQRTVLRFLNALVDKNRALRADTDTPPDPAMLNRALHGVRRLVTHDVLVAIVSDFDGADDETTELVTSLARHNDVVAVPVYDPISTEPPKGRRVVVSQGELQIELALGDASTRRRVTEFADERLARVTAWERELKIPVLPVSTARDSVEQLREMLGFVG